MNKIFINLINPVNWIKAYRFHKSTRTFDKSSFDLELFLYSKMLRNDMLHYGYFEDVNIDPDDISIKQFEDAQLLYAQNIINQIKDCDAHVLDVGCGMGGLSGLMLKKNMKVEALTPNVNQLEYIRNKYPQLIVHHLKLEDFVPLKKYKTIINSESLQYIKLDDAFKIINIALDQGGRWIITDYFRNTESLENKSGHTYGNFIKQVEENGWQVVYECDISDNILPTLKYVNMYAQRIFLPIKHLAYEKLRYKKPWLYYLTNEMRAKIDAKISKELNSIDPEIFIKEKKYFLLVLERK